MCGRYALFLPPEALRALFRTFNPLPNMAPNWNVTPTQTAPVVRRHPETGERRLDMLAWGLVPHFTKHLNAARKPVNARSEAAPSSGMFRDALTRRRCLVPADPNHPCAAWVREGHLWKRCEQCRLRAASAEAFLRAAPPLSCYTGRHVGERFLKAIASRCGTRFGGPCKGNRRFSPNTG